MTAYLFGGCALVILALGGGNYVQYQHNESLVAKNASLVQSNKDLLATVTGLQNAAKSRNTIDSTVRSMSDSELIDGLR